MARAWVEWGNNREGPDFRDASPSIIQYYVNKNRVQPMHPAFVILKMYLSVWTNY